MNIIDSILLFLVSLFALRGYFKGLFRESFSLLGLIMGFAVAARYDERLAALSSEYWHLPPMVHQAACFIGLFLLIYLLFSLTGRLLHRAATVLFLQIVNRVGGVVIGAGEGTAVLALGILLLASFPLMPQGTQKKIDGSYLAPPLEQLARELVRVGKANLLPGDDDADQEKKTAGSFLSGG